ncbi:ubiquinol-cytochrome-c reductase complex assembly factor 1-like [Argopecten irradians]|uniref:ubiquinol-cytochrome-c reductase complex assembly factor 1-like n=1 Tax=Argopecten irradians TaxID=31199 RepID=UPI003717BF91
MLGIRWMTRTTRCACQNAIKTGSKVNKHRSPLLLSGQTQQRIPAHLSVAGCSNNIIKTEEQTPNKEFEAFHDISFLRKVKHAVGYQRDLKVSYKTLELAAFKSWLMISDHIDHGEFIEELGLPDTFNTWFLICELHVWIILTRLMYEGVEGRYFRNVLVSLMWKSAETRMKQIETVSFFERKAYVDRMKHQLPNALLFYDEGLLSDDKALSNALWNILFEQSDVLAPQMEHVVEFVRKEVYRLDKMDTKDLLEKGFIPFGRLRGDRKKEELQNIFSSLQSVSFVPK